MTYKPQNRELWDIFAMQKKLPCSVREAQKDLLFSALYFAHPRVQSNITRFRIPKLQKNMLCMCIKSELLPPVYEVRGKVMFSFCLSVHTGGGASSVPGSFPGLWSQVLSGGYPSSSRGPGWDWTPPPQAQNGVPPPPPLGLGYHPAPHWRQNRRANTCYAVGGTPLAVTQEDCLLLTI